MKINNYLVNIFIVISFILGVSTLFHSVILNSDTLFATDFLNGILNGDEFKFWKFTPATAYFPDIFLYFVSSIFLEKPFYHILFVSIMQIILMIALTYQLIKNISSTQVDKHKILGTVVIFYTILTVYFNQSGMWFLHMDNNVHIPTIFFTLLGLNFIVVFF